MQHNTTLGGIIFNALKANSSMHKDCTVVLHGNETECRYEETLVSVAAEILVSITDNPETLAAIIAELTEDFAQLHETGDRGVEQEVFQHRDVAQNEHNNPVCPDCRQSTMTEQGCALGCQDDQSDHEPLGPMEEDLIRMERQDLDDAGSDPVVVQE